MKSYILTEKERTVLQKQALSDSEKALLSTLKRRIRLYYPKLRDDMNLVWAIKTEWSLAAKKKVT